MKTVRYLLLFTIFLTGCSDKTIVLPRVAEQGTDSADANGREEALSPVPPTPRLPKHGPPPPPRPHVRPEPRPEPPRKPKPHKPGVKIDAPRFRLHID